MKRPVLISCSMAYHPGWEQMALSLTGDKVEWHFADERPLWFLERIVRRPKIGLVRACLVSVLRAKKCHATLLITHGPIATFWCALFCRLLMVRVDHYADIFNFNDLPRGIRLPLARFAYQQVTRFAVHSKMEIDLYSSYFGIPAERFRLRLWGIGVPEVSPDTAIDKRKYVSSIGGNKRDYATLLEACRSLPEIPFLLVVRPDNLLGLSVPANVRVFVNIPFDESMNILLHSAFTVLPLAGPATPSGHVTLVCAMHLGKAVISTASTGITDYILPGYNGVTCEARSAGSMAEAIQKLWNDPEQVARLAANNHRFGAEHCTETHTRHTLATVLSDWGIPVEAGALRTPGETVP